MIRLIWTQWKSMEYMFDSPFRVLVVDHGSVQSLSQRTLHMYLLKVHTKNTGNRRTPHTKKIVKMLRCSCEPHITMRQTLLHLAKDLVP